MRETAQAGGWASIPTPVRILVLSVFTALLWLLFGVAGSASADEAPAPDHSLLGHSLLGQVGSTLDIVTGQVAAETAPAPSTSGPAAPISVSHLVTPVIHRVDSVVQVVPVVKTIVAPRAVETLTAPVAAGVDAVLGAVTPLDSLSGAVVGNLPSFPEAPAVAVATNSSRSTWSRSTVVDLPGVTSTSPGAPVHSASVGVIAPDAPGSPSAPPVPAAPASPGMVSGSATSGAPVAFAAITVAPSVTDRVLGRGSLPQNDSLPSSLSLVPGSSPD